MANPFLMGDLESGDTQVSSISNSFNPFLSGDFTSTNTAENPFIGTFPDSGDHKFNSEIVSTNPFTFSNDTGDVTNLFGSYTSDEEKEKDKSHMTQETINYDDIFSTETKSFTNDNLNDFFGITSTTVNQMASCSETLSSDNTTLLENTVPCNFFVIEPADVKHDAASGMSTPKAGPPKRPPPPRPFAPPSKETKDLILSVTGAMEATSSDLLDRLRATRTPSPTPIKDLNSPSPTPDVSFNELLETEEPMQKDHNILPIQDLDLLGDMDTDNSIPSVPAPSSDIQSMVLTLSTVPTLPSDNVNLIDTVIQPSSYQLNASTSTPPRSAPPIVPERPKFPPQIMTQDIIDAFDTDEHLQHETEINQEIVSIFDGPTSETSETTIISTDQPLKFTSPEIISSIITTTQVPQSLLETHVDDKPSIIHNIAETKRPDFNILDTNITNLTSSVNEASLFFDNTEQTDPSLALSEQPVESLTQSQPFNIFDQNSSGHIKATSDDFDAFTAKFENAKLDESISNTTGAVDDPFDPFSSSAFASLSLSKGQSEGDVSMGFGADDNFDSFLGLQEPPPVPQSTPARFSRAESADSDDVDNDFNIFIKPKQQTDGVAVEGADILPALAPPPKSPVQNSTFQDSSPRFNPFDKSQDVNQVTENIFAEVEQHEKQVERSDSQETPPTPLFDEDVSQPLEDFPRINYTGPGWEMQLRQPNKKKITGQRFWKKVFIKLVYQGENPVLQLLNNKDDKDPFQELPLQPCYSVSEIGAQQYDNYGKIFTVKLQFIFYKERPGVRPGQVTKAERITNKLSQFAAYAIQGDYQGVKEFGSDLKKLGLPVEHAPQISQLFKIGSQNYEDMKQFSVCVEEALFRLAAHRDRALNYKMEEVQITAVDELYVDQNKNGGIIKQIARVRLFFLGFLSGMPDVELGVNDMVRQGKEVVGRHDIIPVVTEEWIRLERVEFHSCVQQDEYERTRTIKFKPPDACYIELMRFRVRPPRNRELPLQLKTKMCITGNKVELRADILVPGFASRKLGQIPCEDVVVRFPIPECWIYLFRVEKHFRYGSVKSAHRRTGKIKGIERFLGAVDNLEPSLMEVTSGQAKYEHQHRAIVWRMPRLPKEGQGAYTTHNLVCKMALTSYDQIPDELAQYCYVEFTMPATQVSHTTARSVSITNSDSDTPPEKYVRQLARHEYRVEIEHTQADGPGEYIAATMAKPVAPVMEEQPPAAPDSDSDSSS